MGSTLAVVTAQGDPISLETVKKVARLARLALSDAQAQQYRSQLAGVLTLAQRLAAVDVSDVEPMASPFETPSPLAEDRPGAVLPTSALMEMAPAKAPPFVLVPRVLGEGGGA